VDHKKVKAIKKERPNDRAAGTFQSGGGRRQRPRAMSQIHKEEDLPARPIKAKGRRQKTLKGAAGSGGWGLRSCEVETRTRTRQQKKGPFTGEKQKTAAA